MRLSQSLFATLREESADAEISSHKLLLRAGYIRRIGSDLYGYSPLIWRMLTKIRQIVEEEIDTKHGLTIPLLTVQSLFVEFERSLAAGKRGRYAATI